VDCGIGGGGGEEGMTTLVDRRRAFIGKLLKAPLKPNERRFLWGLWEQLGKANFELSPKQAEWLRNISRRIGQ
jgi:hypothetical protein